MYRFQLFIVFIYEAISGFHYSLFCPRAKPFPIGKKSSNMPFNPGYIDDHINGISAITSLIDKKINLKINFKLTIHSTNLIGFKNL